MTPARPHAASKQFVGNLLHAIPLEEGTSPGVAKAARTVPKVWDSHTIPYLFAVLGFFAWLRRLDENTFQLKAVGYCTFPGEGGGEVSHSTCLSPSPQVGCR